MEMSMMRSGMMRSGISRIAIQSPPSKGAVCMKYCVLLLVMFMSMFLLGIAFYFAFLHKDRKKTEEKDVVTAEQCNRIDFTPNYEDPPLICSMDGHVTSLRYPERLCSHIVFLSAIVGSAQEAKPADGVEASFQKFKNLRRTYGTVKKLLSFDVSEISTISMDVLHNAYLSIPDNWLDGIDIRYISGNEPSLHLFKMLRKLADGQSYTLHGVFDSVKIDVMKDFHIATLRVYKQLTPPGPFKAVSLQPTSDVERAVGEYDTAVEGANLAAFGNHCIAFSLAAVQYDGARVYGDNAVDFAKVPYCSDDYERKGSPTTPNGHSHYVRNDKMDSLFVFEAPEHFKSKVIQTRREALGEMEAAVDEQIAKNDGEQGMLLELTFQQVDFVRTSGQQLTKVGKIGRMSKACLMLDDIYFDRHTCTCDDMNFKLLKTARRVLWQTLKG